VLEDELPVTDDELEVEELEVLDDDVVELLVVDELEVDEEVVELLDVEDEEVDELDVEDVLEDEELPLRSPPSKSSPRAKSPPYATTPACPAADIVASVVEIIVVPLTLHTILVPDISILSISFTAKLASV
jgi:hypothetical protein